MTALVDRAASLRDAVAGAGGRLSRLPLAGRAAAWTALVVTAYLVGNAVLPKGLPIGYLLLGAVFGSFYALAAVGVVLIYRANRVVNFAQAEFGSVAAVLAIEFKLQLGWNYFLAIGAGLAIAVVNGALVNVLVIRRFRNAPRLILAVATIGIAQVLAGIALVIPILWQGLGTGSFTTPFDVRFSVHPVIFNGNHVLAMVAVPLVMAGVMAFLRFTDYGVVIRASAENADRASLLGVPVPRLSTIVWSLASLLSAMAVLLRIPILGFQSFISVSGGGPSLLLRTLAAAVIGRMENLPRTVAAAIAIGVFERAADWQVPRTTVVDAMLVVVILVALLAQRGFFSRVAETGISSWKAIREIRAVPAELRHLPEVRWAFRGLKLLLFAAAFSLPLVASPSQEAAAAIVCVYAMVAVSLLVLTGWAGHISLGQFALVGFGGATTAVLYGRHGWDITLALLAGVVVSALVALVIGLPALRIRGPFLAVTTLAFATTASTFLLEDRYFPWFIESSIDRPVLWERISLEEDWKMYVFSLLMLWFVIAAARNLRRSHTGRVLIAVRDNEVQAEATTMNTTRLKLQAFLVSGAMAGLAGGVYVIQQNGLHTDAFDPAVSIRLFSMVVIGGLGSLPGAVLGAVYIKATEAILPGGWELIASGTGILLLLMFLPEGLGGLLYGVRDAYLRRVAHRRGILVPSLVADKRVVAEAGEVTAEQEKAEDAATIDAALGGLSSKTVELTGEVAATDRAEPAAAASNGSIPERRPRRREVAR